MFILPFFLQSTAAFLSSPSCISISDILNAKQEYMIRHLINDFVIEKGPGGEGALIDLQISLDQLALELCNHTKQFVAIASFTFGITVHKAHGMLSVWAPSHDNVFEVLCEQIFPAESKTLSPDMREQTPKCSLPTEVQRKRDFLNLSSQIYQNLNKELSNIYLASSLINEALELIQNNQKTRTSAPGL